MLSTLSNVRNGLNCSINSFLLKPALRKTLRYTTIALLLLFVTSFCYALYLRWFPPVTTPLMVMRALGPKEKDDWQLRARWRGYEDISANAKLAVIASEDQNFAFHHGFDYEAIEKAMKHNKKGKKIRGASTISQQVAKNVFLWPGRSWIRKGFEVYFTFLIETLWSKERILTMYLNVAEMGDGIFGVEAASQRYFKKTGGCA